MHSDLEGMATCYYCGEIISATNVSSEHIIQQCLGGRLKSRKLLCRTCNRSLGENIDSEITKLAHIYGNKYGISREDNKLPKINAKELYTGNRLIVERNFIVKYQDPAIKEIPGGYIISHYDLSRVNQEVERFIKENKLNGNKLQVDSRSETTPKEDVTFIIEEYMHADTLFRAISKIFINYYIHIRSNDQWISTTINFLKGEMHQRFVAPYHLNFCGKHHASNPYHILIIRGSKKSTALYGYLELFGEKGFLILMNGRYKGDDFQINYTFDPVKGKEINLDYEFSLDMSCLISLLYNQENHSDMVFDI